MSEVHIDRSRQPSVHIPTEVCENIIDMLYSLQTPDTLINITTLHSCALVCRDWRIRSQRMLFYQVQLADTTSFHRLSKILDDAPHLRDYVYQVSLTGYHLHRTTSIFARFPAVFAGKLPNLFWIDVVHFYDTTETRFPRASGSPKAKTLPYIPLHPRFAAFLSVFTAVSELSLYYTTFRTFTEFTRMLHGLPNLKRLLCNSVRWITPGGSHPGAHFARQPEWAVCKGAPPPFAPKLRRLWFWDIAIYEAKRLIWTRGPSLTSLSLTVPLLKSPEKPAEGSVINLGPCTGLRTLDLYVTSQFSMDMHGQGITELLSSWEPLHPEPLLQLFPETQSSTTRQGFANALRDLGTITEAWLETLADPPPAGGNQDHQPVKFQLKVRIFEWEAQRRGWLDHMDVCFPTWVKLGQIELIIVPPRDSFETWGDETPPQSNAVLVSQVQVESCTLSNVKDS